MEIIDRILLLLAGRDQKELTNYLGLNSVAFSEWKSGKSKSYRKYLIEISEFFNVSLDYLVYGKEIQNTLMIDEKANDNSIHTGNVTNSKIIGGHDNSLTSPISISDDALEIDKIIKSFDPKKRAKFLYQVYDLAEKLKEN